MKTVHTMRCALFSHVNPWILPPREGAVVLTLLQLILPLAGANLHLVDEEAGPGQGTGR